MLDRKDHVKCWYQVQRVLSRQVSRISMGQNPPDLTIIIPLKRIAICCHLSFWLLGILCAFQQKKQMASQQRYTGNYWDLRIFNFGQCVKPFLITRSCHLSLYNQWTTNCMRDILRKCALLALPSQEKNCCFFIHTNSIL